jgi:hypothetical protein
MRPCEPSSSDRTVIMVLLDAFSSKYLNPKYCPLLYDISQKGFTSSLRSMFAFEGISASILTGTLPNTNKIWLDYVFKESRARRGSTSRFFKHLIKVFDVIPNDDVNKYLRFMLHKVFRQPIATPNLIPPNMLPFFEPRVKGYGTSTGGIATLFDQLDKYGLTYYVSGLFDALPDRFAVWKFLRKSSEDHALFMLKLTSLDRLGHKYGPESHEVHDRVLQIDKTLAKVMKRFSVRRRSAYFIIFSDHGMTPVKHYVNFFRFLDRLPYKIPSDYILFLSSTVANFFFFNPKVREDIVDLLSRASFGKVLTQAQLAELGINKVGTEYGELIFALKQGYVFFPDFYRKITPPKGMHGYSHSAFDSPILLIYASDLSTTFDTERVAQQIDIMPTVLDLLDLPIPRTVEGKSLLIKH